MNGLGAYKKRYPQRQESKDGFQKDLKGREPKPISGLGFFNYLILYFAILHISWPVNNIREDFSAKEAMDHR